MSIACHPKPPCGRPAPSHVPYSACLLSAGIWAGALLPSGGTPSFLPFLYWRTFCHLCPSLQREAYPQWSAPWRLPLLLAGCNTQREKKGFSPPDRCLSLSSVDQGIVSILFTLLPLPEKKKSMALRAKLLAGFPGLDWHLLSGPSLERNPIPTGFNFWDS